MPKFISEQERCLRAGGGLLFVSVFLPTHPLSLPVTGVRVGVKVRIERTEAPGGLADAAERRRGGREGGRPGPAPAVAPSPRVCPPNARVASGARPGRPARPAERNGPGARAGSAQETGATRAWMPEPYPQRKTDVPPQTPPTSPKPPASLPRARAVKGKGKAIAA